MSTNRTHIAETAARVPPFIWSADWTCMCVANDGPADRLEASLIQTRV